MNPLETSHSPLSLINPFTPKPLPMMTLTNGAISSNLRSDLSFSCTAPSAGQISSRNNNNQWDKPKRVLPLSLFGGEEEEDSRVVVAASTSDVKVKHPFTDKSNDNKQLKSDNRFDDIIANLYGEVEIRVSFREDDDDNDEWKMKLMKKNDVKE
ncbi:hypothetical protein LguiB_000580 [Lonicera macranthoides]